MYEEILKQIIDYLVNEIDDESIEILPESNLMDDLSLNSLEMLRALILLENRLGIRIPEKYLRKMVTVRDVADIIYEIIQKEKNQKEM